MIIIVVWILLMHVYPDKDQTPVLYINVNQYKTKKKKKKKNVSLKRILSPVLTRLSTFTSSIMVKQCLLLLLLYIL